MAVYREKEGLMNRRIRRGLACAAVAVSLVRRLSPGPT